MKQFIWLISSIALAMTLGCKEREAEQVAGEEYGKAVEEAEVQVDKAQEGVADMTANQEQYLQGLENRIDELDSRIQELEGMANERAADLRQKLAQERQELNERFTQARQASADEWKQAKADVDQAIEDVQRAYEAAAAELSDEK